MMASFIDVTPTRAATVERLGFLTTAGSRVLFCAVVVILVGWGILWFDLQDRRDRHIAEVERQTGNLVSVLEDHTARTIMAVDQALIDISDDHATTALDEGRSEYGSQELVGRLPLLPQLRSLIILNRNGQVVATTSMSNPIGASMANRSFFREIKDARFDPGLYFSGVVRSQSSSQWILGVSRRINGPNGAFRGVVHAAIDPAFFAGLYKSIDVGPRGNVSLFDNNGNFIARWPQHETYIGRSAANGPLFVRYLPHADSGTVRLTGVVDGRDILLSYKTIRNQPLVINVAADMRDVLSPWYIDRRKAAITAFAFAMIVVLIALLLQRQIRSDERVRMAQHQKMIAVASQQASEKSEAQLREILDSMFAFVGLFTLDGVLVEANRATLAAAGLDRQDVIGLPFWETYWWSYSEASQSQVRDALRRAALGQQVRQDFVVRIADDQFITIDAVFSRLYASGSEPSMLIGSGVDISDRVRVEETLRTSEARLNNAQRIANLGNWDWDIATNALAWSDQIFRIFGLQPQQFGANYPAFLERVHPEDRASVEAAVGRALAGIAPYSIDHRIVRPDGTVHIVHEQGEVVRDEGGRPLRMTGLVQDVTEIRDAEEARRASESRLVAILGIAPEAIIVVNGTGNIEMFNVGAEKTFGYSAKDMIGRSMDVLIPDRFRISHRSMMRSFGEGRVQSRLMAERRGIVGLRQDGSEFPAEASVAKLDVGGERLFTVILRDVTERVAAERELVAAKEEAERASRAKSIFMANIGHELRTPLNAIMGFSGIIKSRLLDLDQPGDYVSYAEEIRSGGQRLLDIISDILTLTNIESGKLRIEGDAVDLIDVVNAELLSIAGVAASGGIRVASDLPEHLPWTLGEERLLRMALGKLLSNAVKFTPSGGEVTVSASEVIEGWVEIEVSDNGVGMDEADIPGAMSAFKQVDDALNRRYEGVGLGLPIAKSLIELHRGELALKSAPGCGTRATIRLPVEPASAESSCLSAPSGTRLTS